MQLSLVTRCRVTRNLDAVTTVGQEAPARDVGVEADAVERIWAAARNLYASGMHPALQLCVRHRGEVILNRAIGHASGNAPDDPPDAPKVRVTPETPFTIFSASKAVTAMVIHLLDQRNLIRLDDPVCEYIPEFGTNKKQWITIRHVLSHRSGIPNIPPEAMDLDRLRDPHGIVQLLCEGSPLWRPGRYLAYHAITGGFVLAEIVRRVTGKTLPAFMEANFCRPLGFRWFNYGVRSGDVKRVARNAFTGLPPLPPLSTLLERALGAGFKEVTATSNDPRFLRGLIPSANLVATADEMSRFYQLLLNGGELDGVRIYDTRTIRRALVEHAYLEVDLTLLLPVRHGLGLMLGGEWLSPFGTDTRYAFGHLGFTNILTWADPERRISAALHTSGKPLIYPEIAYAFQILREIGQACAKTRVAPRDFFKPEHTRPRLRSVPKKRPAPPGAAETARA